jgi:hydrogenase small subunit
MPQITRRQVLKRIYQAIVAAGASSFISFADLLSAEAIPKSARPDVIWLHGSSCSGCSISLLDLDYVPVVDVVTRFANIVYHPDLSAATGDQAIDLIERTRTSGRPFLFVLEGGIPAGMPHACLMGDRPITEWVEQLARAASACIAAGTCASLGGIPQMHGSETGNRTLPQYLQDRAISKPVISLPGCPMKPEHFLYTLLHMVRKGAPPPLDSLGRPLEFFANTIHERCIYYADFQENHFARFIGDKGCLLKLGCQGPVTHSDCMINGHNGNTNSCIRAGHPCIGCASEHFPRRIMLHSFNDPRVIIGKSDEWDEV